MQYEDDDAENEEDDDDDGDGGMAEGAEESNEGSGSGDGNEAYEGDEAEVTRDPLGCLLKSLLDCTSDGLFMRYDVFTGRRVSGSGCRQ